MKRHSLIIILSILWIMSYSQNPFVTTWKTDNPGTSEDNQILFPAVGVGNSYNVDWGDGTSDTGQSGSIIHTYVTPGTYVVSVTGTIAGVRFNGTGNKDKIISIQQWGDLAWESMAHAFYGCTNLYSVAGDEPDLSRVTSLSAAFLGATSFVGDLSSWDVSNVTDMSYMFYQTESFTDDLSSWDVSNVTDMNRMFIFASFFNGDMTTWNTSQVTNMRSMFANALNFNQDISNWNTSAVTDMGYMFSKAEKFNQNLDSWDVRNVTDISGMFNSALNFNQDLSSWNTSQVTDMSNTFFVADSFDQDIGDWDISNVTNMRSMFDRAGLSKENYDYILDGWAKASSPAGIELGACGLSYCLAQQALDFLTNTEQWNIDDNGQDCTKSNQTIAFEPLSPVGIGVDDFELTASTSSGLGVVSTSSDPSVATIASSTVILVSPGSVQITASQPGNDYYRPAAFINYQDI